VKYWAPAVLALALATGCITRTQAGSSRAVLPPERSMLVVARPVRPTMLEITRLFAQRGFPLVEQRADSRGVVLRFKGERKLVTQPVIDELTVLAAFAHELATDEEVTHGRPSRHHHGHDRYYERTEQIEVGSVFYVRFEPRGDATAVYAIGRPTKNGRDGCTSDPDLDAPCAELDAHGEYYRHIDGTAEAEVIEGVFAEQRLHGGVAAAASATTAAGERCLARRRELADLARRVSDPRAREGILRTSPAC